MGLMSLTAVELGKKIQSGEVKVLDAVNEALARIEIFDKQLNCYVTVDAEGARKRAEEVQKAIDAGKLTGPLAGVPVAIKDNMCTEGLLTTCSSKILYNFKPTYTAEAVKNLEKAGAIIIGKTNMDEFAMGSSTETSYFKKTKNPRGLDRVPGGSSGGSAAAVAAGEAPISLGSDTGGSIRQPASFCGVVGLKPTYGAVSRYGLVAFASSLDQIGPFGRTVEDVAMLFSAICGRDPMDATSSKHEHEDVMAALNGDVKGLRIGIPAEYFGDGIDAEVKESVMAAVKKLEEQGAIVKEISLPSTKYALPAYYIIASAEASSNLARFDGVKYGYRAKEFTDLTDMYERTRSEGFGEEVKRRIMLGTFVLSSGYYDAYYNRAKLLQRQIADEFAKGFEECDVMITPTSPSTAFKFGANSSDPVKMYAADICTINVNIAGLPGISVPCGVGADGMPIGMQMIGPKFSEATLLRTAANYEKICGGFGSVADLD